MKKLPLTLAAVALGAAAVYFLDPRQGPQRRQAVAQRSRDWMDALSEAASRQMDTLGGWMDSVQQRMGRSHEARVEDEDGLEPLSMTPPPLEEERSRRSRMLPALAVATPVAMAMGAAWLRHRNEEGDWLH